MAKARIIATNGDELYFTIEGAILPSHYTDYDFEFQDPFTFIGGGRTNSFVDQSEDSTDHVWKGTLILPESDDDEDDELIHSYPERSLLSKLLTLRMFDCVEGFICLKMNSENYLITVSSG